MNFEYDHLLPKNFDRKSRVWIYQSSRCFGISEALEIESILHNFVGNWKSHGATVKGYANLFFGQFVVLIADETQNNVGGCSTDSSVRIIKEIGDMFKVDMFNRQHLAFKIKDKVEIVPFNQVLYALQNGIINSDTIYFNNLVSTLDELTNNWLIPVKTSWLGTKINNQLLQTNS